AQKPRAPSEEKGTKAEPQLTAASEGKADSASVIQQKAALSNTVSDSSDAQVDDEELPPRETQPDSNRRPPSAASPPRRIDE
ncbi:MAG: hypothetical protein ONB12_01830, partial [candidate division KSB1 bacterium]|nr:hypothetical protein [candidate division KSB1 bacterium]